MTKEKELQKNSLSTILSEAMKNSGISVEKLAEETGVSERFILSILEEDFSKMPPTPYLHGYVIKIFEHFNIDGEKVWNTYFKGSELLKQSGKNDKLPENRFSVSRIDNKILIVAFLIIAIPIYFIISSLYQGDLSRKLTIDNLNNEEVAITSTSTYVVEGSIDDNLNLLINGERVSPDVSGNFEFNLNLSSGFNTVTFEIEGPLGKTETVTRQIFYESEEEEEEPLEETPTSTEEETINDFQEQNFEESF